MTERSFPGYDVLAKRDTPSWNAPTRSTIDKRLAVPREPRFFSSDDFETLKAVCERILPQPATRAEPVPLAALVDAKIFEGQHDGYRFDKLPAQGEARTIGLAALDHEARTRHGARFRDLSGADRDDILRAMQRGVLDGDHWRGMPLKLVFQKRVVQDVTDAYYGHPTAWNEIGFGGPASPRGYARGREPARPVGGGRGQARAGRARQAGERPCRLTLSNAPAPPTAARRTSSRRAAGSRCASTATPTRWISPSWARAPAAARWRRASPRRAIRSWPSTPAPISGRWRISPPTRPSRKSFTGTTRASSKAPIPS